MKRLFAAAVAVALAVGFSSCKEVNPLTTTNPVDTTTTLQQKNILIEDITGVHCPNCPQAHEYTQQLQDTFPGRVEVIAVHNGDLAFPYSGEPDFRVSAGDAINAYLGPADYWPKGAIDRKLYDGQSEVLLDRSVWNGIATQRLNDTLKLEMALSKNYNAATRKLDLNVSLTYLTDDHVDTAYTHNNVLRAALTDPLGESITEATTAGAQLQRTYSYTLPAGWTAQNCRAVVFVSRNTPDPNVGKEVLQVRGINVD
jgi:hypothetical protein